MWIEELHNTYAVCNYTRNMKGYLSLKNALEFEKKEIG